MVAMQDNPKRPKVLRDWFEWRLSVTDLLLGTVLSLGGVGWMSQYVSLAGTLAVFIWLLGVCGLLIPTLHDLVNYLLGRNQRPRIDILQCAIGIVLLTGILVLWYSFPEDMKGMVNRTFSVYSVLAAAALLLFGFFFSMAVRSAKAGVPAHGLVASNTGEAASFASDEKADFERSRKEMEQASEKAKQNYEAALAEKQSELNKAKSSLEAVMAKYALLEQDNLVFTEMARRMGESKTNGALKRAVVEYWLEGFRSLNSEKISSNSELELWNKKLNRMKNETRDMMVKFFGQSVLSPQYFARDAVRPTMGKKFDNSYDDTHSKGLNEVAAIIRDLTKQQEKLGADSMAISNVIELQKRVEAKENNLDQEKKQLDVKRAAETAKLADMATQLSVSEGMLRSYENVIIDQGLDAVLFAKAALRYCTMGLKMRLSAPWPTEAQQESIFREELSKAENVLSRFFEKSVVESDLVLNKHGQPEDFGRTNDKKAAIMDRSKTIITALEARMKALEADEKNAGLRDFGKK